MATKWIPTAWLVLSVVLGWTLIVTTVSRGDDGRSTGLASQTERSIVETEGDGTTYEAYEEDYEYDYGYPEDLAVWESEEVDTEADVPATAPVAGHIIDYHQNVIPGTFWEQAEEQATHERATEDDASPPALDEAGEVDEPGADDSLYGDAYEAADDWDAYTQDVYAYERVRAHEYVADNCDEAREKSGRELLAEAYLHEVETPVTATDQQDDLDPADPATPPFDGLPETPDWQSWYSPEVLPQPWLGLESTWPDEAPTYDEPAVEMGHWFEESFGAESSAGSDPTPVGALLLAVRRLMESDAMADQPCEIHFEADAEEGAIDEVPGAEASSGESTSDGQSLQRIVESMPLSSNASGGVPVFVAFCVLRDATAGSLH